MDATNDRTAVTDIAAADAPSNAISYVLTIINDFLAESGVEPCDVPGWRQITAAEVNSILGRSGRNSVTNSGIEIPYFNLDGSPVLDRGQGFRRVRLIDAGPEMPKYLSRAGSGNHVFVPHGFRKLVESWKSILPEDSVGGKTLVICEGEKKAARLVKMGIAAVGIAGVQMWADSSFRDREKSDAEKAGKKSPHMTRKTPVSPEILQIVRSSGADHVVILFDSDGLPVESSDPGIDARFKSLPSGQSCLNPDVFWAGKTFAAALMRSLPGIPVGLSFAPHTVDPENGHFGRQGIDDYSLSIPPNELTVFIENCAAECVSMSPEQVQKESDRIEHEKYLEELKKRQGFIPLGYSSSEDSTNFHVWSKYLEVIKSFNDSSLSRKSAFYGVFGSEYCDQILGRDFVVQKADEKTGKEEIIEKRFDLDLGQRTVVASCQSAGMWRRESSVRGGGVWRDKESDGLVINAKNGIRLVRADGTAEEIERIRGGLIYESSHSGEWCDDSASIADVVEIVETIERSWNWSAPTSGMLLAGWVCAQAYVAALEARPGVMLSGESNSAKSHLQDYLLKLINMWAIRFEAARTVSEAGLSQEIKNDAVTIFFDEIEPKAGASAESYSKINQRLTETLQLMRTAYSKSDNSRSFGSVKGTARQEAVSRDVRVCPMYASVAEIECEQADRNRNIRLKLKALTAANPKKELPLDGSLGHLGLRIFRKMWGKWPAYNSTLKTVEKMIDHPEPRMRTTLATPIAALAVALDKEGDAAWIVAVAEAVNAEHGGSGSDDSPRDQNRALDRLLAATVDVGGLKKPVGDTVVSALAAGLGRQGRNSGGPDADALRLNGLTARRNHDGTISIFVAAGHQGVETLGRQIGVVNLSSLLAAVDGAKKTTRDDRVRLGAGSKWSGVWVPTEISMIVAVETEDRPEMAAVGAEAAPY